MPSSSLRLRVNEKLILAAYRLAEEGRNPFTAEELVVSAWRLFPDTFGLAGYADGQGNALYPDSNRVFAEIMGSKPLRRLGFLKKTASKTYELTRSGLEVAQNLRSSEPKNGVEKSLLSRDVKQCIRRLLESRVLTKFLQGGEQALTFHDACVFWGISPRISAVGFRGKVSELRHFLALARDETSRSPTALEHRGQEITPERVASLLELDRALCTKFKSEIDVILRRTDERA